MCSRSRSIILTKAQPPMSPGYVDRRPPEMGNNGKLKGCSLFLCMPPLESRSRPCSNPGLYNVLLGIPASGPIFTHLCPLLFTDSFAFESITLFVAYCWRLSSSLCFLKLWILLITNTIYHSHTLALTSRKLPIWFQSLSPYFYFSLEGAHTPLTLYTRSVRHQTLIFDA